MTNKDQTQMKPLKYRSELMCLTNLETGKKRYYVGKCGVMTRISHEDYTKRYDTADGFSCRFEVQSKKHTRKYITAVYEG